MASARSPIPSSGSSRRRIWQAPGRLACRRSAPSATLAADPRSEAALIAWSLIFWAGFCATLAVSWLGGVAYCYGLTRFRPSAVLAGLVFRRPTGVLRHLGSALNLALGAFLFPTL